MVCSSGTAGPKTEAVSCAAGKVCVVSYKDPVCSDYDKIGMTVTIGECIAENSQSTKGSLNGKVINIAFYTDNACKTLNSTKADDTIPGNACMEGGYGSSVSVKQCKII